MGMLTTGLSALTLPVLLLPAATLLGATSRFGCRRVHKEGDPPTI